MNDMMAKRCYLCGRDNSNSGDHVPPKNIFLKKNRVDLITVPAHVACNKQHELDDEYFRYSLLIPSYWESKDARELWNEKIKYKIHKSQSAGFKKYLSQNIKSVDLNTEGGIYLGKADASLLDATRLINVIERIARGLFYKRTNSILPFDWPVHADWMMPYIREDRKNLETMKKFISIGNGIFKYYWEHSESDVRFGMFWLCFFDCVDFWVSTGSTPDKTAQPGNLQT